ncbi:hypothetical protein MMC13_006302 [Lambiella insularis]|nr:hypothetical protein [Lambiella insularis]
MKSFHAFAAAVLAGLASAQNYTTSVVYTTQEITITSCASTVVSCPAESIIVTTSTAIAYTTICPVTATQVPTAAAPVITSSAAAAPAPTTYANSTTILYSPCPSNATVSSTPIMVTRSAVSTAAAGTASLPQFTSIPTGSPVSGMPTGSPIATAAASKMVVGMSGAIALVVAALAL